AVAVVVAGVVSVFAIVPAVLPHVTAVIPHVVSVVVQLTTAFAHVTAVDVEPGIDALCSVETIVASVPEGTAVAEYNRRRNAALAPFIAMPATIHKEHALAVPHAPAIRAMIPGAADVNRVVVVLFVISHIAGACTDDHCWDA